MRALTAIVVLGLAGLAGLGGVRADDPADTCSVPDSLLSADNALNRVAAAVTKEHRLPITVIGTGSSMIPGKDGSNIAYPARLEAALKARLPNVNVTVTARAKPRQTAADMAQTLQKVLLEDKPALVIWQTGTADAMQGVDPEDFRTAINDGIEALHAGGADVILVNMQYSPRTESMIAVGAYADGIRLVAREREVPVFDRLAIMRHWSDTGVFDLYAATKDITLAKRVHDCIGRALAAMIIEGAHLGATGPKDHPKEEDKEAK
jgi:lysophospholipase L1-like esterase